MIQIDENRNRTTKGTPHQNIRVCDGDFPSLLLHFAIISYNFVVARMCVVVKQTLYLQINDMKKNREKEIPLICSTSHLIPFVCVLGHTDYLIICRIKSGKYFNVFGPCCS